MYVVPSGGLWPPLARAVRRRSAQSSCAPLLAVFGLLARFFAPLRGRPCGPPGRSGPAARLVRRRARPRPGRSLPLACGLGPWPPSGGPGPCGLVCAPRSPGAPGPGACGPGFAVAVPSLRSGFKPPPGQKGQKETRCQCWDFMPVSFPSLDISGFLCYAYAKAE